MSDQESEILKAVQESVHQALPSLHADTLGKFIDKAKQDEKSLGDARGQLAKLLEEKNSLLERIAVLTQLKHDADQVAIGKKNLEAAMLKFDIERRLLDKDVEHQKALSTHTLNMFNTVFANAMLKRMIYSNENKSVLTPSGCTSSLPSNSSSNEMNDTL